MSKPPRIEYVDFREKAKKDRRFKDAVGLFLDKENILAVHSGLPEETNGTRALTVAHEMAHARVKRSGAKALLTTAQEESYCELEAVWATYNGSLSSAEELFKTLLFPGLHWGRPADRAFIRAKLLKLIGVRRPNTVAAMLAKKD